jgi:hypothetical protein
MHRPAGFPLRLAVLLASSLAAVGAAHAQSEAELKEYFEGRTVTVKIDMPATDDGIDVWPGAKPPIDFTRYAKRVKATGTAVHAGDAIVVTKVKVKDKLIEFQLGGGGFGTFGDNTSSNVYVHSAEKTQREKNLERDVKTEKDPAKKRAMQEELDGLRKDREREDARNQAAVAEAEEKKKENIRRQALAAGSRFNLRYKDRVPSEAITPDAVMDALAEYVDFGGAPATVSTGSPLTNSDLRPATLRKGLTRAETDDILGQPKATKEGKEGTLHTLTATYESQLGRVEALFVEGILVRYSVSSD